MVAKRPVALERHVGDLVGRAAAACNLASSVEEAALACLRLAAEAAGWPVGHLYLTGTPRAEGLSPTGLWHLTDAERFLAFRLETEDAIDCGRAGFPACVLALGQATWLSDPGHVPDGRRAHVARAAGLRAAFGFPVRAGDRVLGVLEFLAVEDSLPERRLLGAIGELARHLGRVLERVSAEAALRESALLLEARIVERAAEVRREKEFSESLVRCSMDGVLAFDPDCRYTVWNPAMETISGMRAEEVVGRHVLDVFPFLREAGVERVFAAALAGETLMTPELPYLIPETGSAGFYEARYAPMRDGAGRIVGGLGIVRDVTDRNRAEHDALHDALTGLPNRALFMDRLERAVARARRRRDPDFAVLFLDLDRFKVVNDSLGHLAGDELLVAVARRLERCVREGDTVARLGGDEFAVLLEGVGGSEGLHEAAERIHRGVAAPFEVGGREVFTSFSIGIAPGAVEHERPEDLLRDADTAMYRAKALGTARHEIFHPALRERVVARMSLETDLRHAIDREELTVEYQPVVTVATGAVVGFEALLRWLHPQRGRLAPADFLPIAEETGLAAPIGLWVLRTACRQARAWQAMRPGQEVPMLAVNLSSRHCAHPELAAQVEEVLEETGFDARRLRLEISEGAVVDRTDVALGAVARLRERGVRFDIDDFGTGGSSLAHLHRFPASALKMGQPFVERLGDAEGPCIGQTIVALAHGLGLEVIAEGVETPAQLLALRTLGCELAQGHLLSPPLPADRAGALLTSGARLPSGID